MEINRVNFLTGKNITFTSLFGSTLPVFCRVCLSSCERDHKLTTPVSIYFGYRSNSVIIGSRSVAHDACVLSSAASAHVRLLSNARLSPTITSTFYFVNMTSFTALEKVSIALIVIALFFILRSIFRAVYTFAIGPLINKVDFKSKGKWACKYFLTILRELQLFLYYKYVLSILIVAKMHGSVVNS